MNKGFYLTAVFLFTSSFIVLFRIGILWGAEFLVRNLGIATPVQGFDQLTVVWLAALSGISFGSLGVFVDLVILHKLSKRFFPGAEFVKTTLLAFLTFILLLFAYLLFWPQ